MRRKEEQRRSSFRLDRHLAQAVATGEVTVGGVEYEYLSTFERVQHS